MIYRLTHQQSNEEWLSFLHELGADLANWGDGVDGVNDIRTLLKLHWVDGKDVGIADDDVEAARRFVTTNLLFFSFDQPLDELDILSTSETPTPYILAYTVLFSLLSTRIVQPRMLLTLPPPLSTPTAASWWPSMHASTPRKVRRALQASPVNFASSVVSFGRICTWDQKLRFNNLLNCGLWPWSIRNRCTSGQCAGTALKVEEEVGVVKAHSRRLV